MKVTPELTLKLIDTLVECIDKGEMIADSERFLLDNFKDGLRKVRFVEK